MQYMQMTRSSSTLLFQLRKLKKNKVVEINQKILLEILKKGNYDFYNQGKNIWPVNAN